MSDAVIARLTTGVHLDLTPEAGGTPANTLDEDHKMARAALGMESMTFGLAMPDEDVHAPNEFFRLSSFDDGLRAWARALPELAKV